MYSSATSTPRYFSPGPQAPQATRTAMRSSTATSSDGSRTMTITGTPTESSSASGGPSGSTTSTLKLRGGPRNDQHVAWDEDVVDNEGCGKKSSKICCIYHKPKAFDESSSEESDDSDDSEIDERRRYRRQQRRRHNHHDHHDHGHDESGAPQLNGDGHGGSVVHELEGRDDDVNAYERAPSSKKGKHKASS